jgi:hypothetical protein
MEALMTLAAGKINHERLFGTWVTTGNNGGGGMAGIVAAGAGVGGGGGDHEDGLKIVVWA